MKLAIFDFDGTLFPEETVPYIWKHYGRLGYSKVRQGKIFLQMMFLFAQYKINKNSVMSKEQFRGRATEIILTLFEGMTETEVSEFFKILNVNVLKDIDAEVKVYIEKHKAEGFTLVLLSGGYMPLLEPVGSKLGMDHVIGTQLNYKTENGKKIIQPFEPVHIITGENKIKALLEVYGDKDVDWQASYAYADSVYDRDVLEKVGNPVAVNPDRGLQKISLDKNWTILKTKAGAKLDKKIISTK